MLKISDIEFKRLVSFVQSNYGINLTQKRTLIEGRLNNVIQERGFNDYSNYLDMIFADKSGHEMDQLLNKLTTNHTFFMREPKHFEYLREIILPDCEKNNRDNDIRIWSAACSSGEEPYTIAMIIDDYFGSNKSKWDSKILATDISQRVLSKAQSGIYHMESLKDVPDQWMKKYLTKVDAENYKINPKIQSEVIFKTFNLMESIPFRKKPFDLIFCRNVMIYFDLQTKTDLVNRFFDVIKPGGYLFIGHAESIPREATKFQYVKPAIYRRP